MDQFVETVTALSAMRKTEYYTKPPLVSIRSRDGRVGSPSAGGRGQGRKPKENRQEHQAHTSVSFFKQHVVFYLFSQYFWLSLTL